MLRTVQRPGCIKVLASARDPGSAGHIQAVVEALAADDRFQVEILAASPAFEALRGGPVRTHRFQLPDGSDYQPSEAEHAPLLGAARRWLRRIAPDVVLTSMSSFGVSVDEALQACAAVPTFSLQDFWGDVNLGLGRPAETCLVMDEFAAELTRRRWNLCAVPVGAPKYARYRRLDVAQLRSRFRSRVGDAGRLLIGWLGQSPLVPGHEASFRSMLRLRESLPDGATLVLREHPKFPELCEVHALAASRAGFHVFDASADPEVEGCLAACDLLLTPFSLTALDHAYLTANSPRPLGTVVFVLTSPELRQFVHAQCGFLLFPTLRAGIGRAVLDPETLLPTCLQQLSAAGRQEYFDRCRRLPSAEASLTRIAELLAGAAGGSRAGFRSHMVAPPTAHSANRNALRSGSDG
jgi:hypothetical protein